MEEAEVRAVRSERWGWWVLAIGVGYFMMVAAFITRIPS